MILGGVVVALLGLAVLPGGQAGHVDATYCVHYPVISFPNGESFHMSWEQYDFGVKYAARQYDPHRLPSDAPPGGWEAVDAQLEADFFGNRRPIADSGCGTPVTPSYQDTLDRAPLDASSCGEGFLIRREWTAVNLNPGYHSTRTSKATQIITVDDVDEDGDGECDCKELPSAVREIGPSGHDENNNECTFEGPRQRPSWEANDWRAQPAYAQTKYDARLCGFGAGDSAADNVARGNMSLSSDTAYGGVHSLRIGHPGRWGGAVYNTPGRSHYNPSHEWYTIAGASQDFISSPVENLAPPDAPRHDFGTDGNAERLCFSYRIEPDQPAHLLMRFATDHESAAGLRVMDYSFKFAQKGEYEVDYWDQWEVGWCWCGCFCGCCGRHERDRIEEGWVRSPVRYKVNLPLYDQPGFRYGSQPDGILTRCTDGVTMGEVGPVVRDGKWHRLCVNLKEMLRTASLRYGRAASSEPAVYDICKRAPQHARLLAISTMFSSPIGAHQYAMSDVPYAHRPEINQRWGKATGEEGHGGVGRTTPTGLQGYYQLPRYMTSQHWTPADDRLNLGDVGGDWPDGSRHYSGWGYSSSGRTVWAVYGEQWRVGPHPRSVIARQEVIGSRTHVPGWTKAWEDVVKPHVLDEVASRWTLFRYIRPIRKPIYFDDFIIDGPRCDLCPRDPHKPSPGACGCGVSDADHDGDGTPDCDDPSFAEGETVKICKPKELGQNQFVCFYNVRTMPLPLTTMVAGRGDAHHCSRRFDSSKPIHVSKTSTRTQSSGGWLRPSDRKWCDAIRRAAGARRLEPGTSGDADNAGRAPVEHGDEAYDGEDEGGDGGDEGVPAAPRRHLKGSHVAEADEEVLTAGANGTGTRRLAASFDPLSLTPICHTNMERNIIYYNWYKGGTVCMEAWHTQYESSRTYTITVTGTNLCGEPATAWRTFKVDDYGSAANKAVCLHPNAQLWCGRSWRDSFDASKCPLEL